MIRDSIGPDLEPVILSCLLQSEDFASYHIRHISEDAFTDDHRRFVFHLLADYTNEYGEPPTIPVMRDLVKNSRHSDVGGLLATVDNLPTPQPKYAGDRVMDWVRWRAVDLTLADVDRFDDPQDFARQLAESVNGHTGSDLDFTDLAEAHDEHDIVRDSVPSPWSWLNNRLPADGPERQDLAVILTVINGGKTTIMTNIARHAIALGKSVVFFTFEDGETKIKRRLTQSITGWSLNQLAMKAAEGRRLRSRFLEKTGGSCVIKRLESRRSTVQDAINLVDAIASKRGVPVDLVITDYADRFKPQNSRNEPRHELREVYEDCKYLAGHHDVVHWTASQVNKTMTGKAMVGIEHGSESTGKFESCDIAVGFGQTPEERMVKSMTMHTSKMRDGDKGETTTLIADFDTQRIYERNDPVMDKRRFK